MNRHRPFHTVLALSVFFSVAPLSAEEIRDLVIVAGQSNAVGFDAPPRLLPPDPADEGILFCYLHIDTTGTETLPPHHYHFTAAGTLELGHRLAAALLELEAREK